MTLAMWNFSLHFLRSFLGISKQKREFVSCLDWSAAVSAVPADFGAPRVSCANTVAAGKGQAVCERAALLLFLPCGAQQGGTGRSVWAPRQLAGKDNIFDWKHRASKVYSLLIRQQNGLVQKSMHASITCCNWNQGGGTGRHLVS